LVEQTQGARDLYRRALTLHADGHQQDTHIRKAPPQDANDVANGSTLRRSDEPDPAGQARQFLFVLGVEKPFAFQPALQLFKGELQRAAPGRVHALDINLILAALLVHADRTAHGHLQPVFRPESHAAHLLAKPDAFDLRFFILQREVDMSGLRLAAIRDFTL